MKAKITVNGVSHDSTTEPSKTGYNIKEGKNVSGITYITHINGEKNKKGIIELDAGTYELTLMCEYYHNSVVKSILIYILPNKIKRALTNEDVTEPMKKVVTVEDSKKYQVFYSLSDSAFVFKEIV